VRRGLQSHLDGESALGALEFAEDLESIADASGAAQER
jgi:hypothetical protein